MAKFKRVEINGQYQFQPINSAAKKVVEKLGLETVTVSGMLMVASATKGRVEFF